MEKKTIFSALCQMSTWIYVYKKLLASEIVITCFCKHKKKKQQRMYVFQVVVIIISVFFFFFLLKRKIKNYYDIEIDSVEYIGNVNNQADFFHSPESSMDFRLNVNMFISKLFLLFFLSIYMIVNKRK